MQLRQFQKNGLRGYNMKEPKFFYDMNEVKAVANRSFLWGAVAGAVGFIIFVAVLEAGGVLKLVEQLLQ
jgi:hypothetical protein